MKHCINCGGEINENAEVCTACGFNQTVNLEGEYDNRAENEKFCIECGVQIYRQAEICPECGVRQPPTQRRSSRRETDQVVAGILAILLGGLGVHKFYQGNMSMGVLYLCFFWTFIPAILAFIEGILILVVDEEEYEERFADGSILGR